MGRRRSQLVTFLFVLATACGGSSGDGTSAQAPSARRVVLRWQVTEAATGFVIHWGTRPRDYTDALDIGLPVIAPDGIATFLLEAIEAPGTYVFALTAYDDVGQESGYSNEMVAIVP